MKFTKVLALSLAMTSGAFAQSTSSELKELKDAIAAQQQQIQQLQQQVQSRDAAIQQLQQQVGQAQAAANQAESTAKSALGGEKKEGALSAEEFAALQHEVTDLKAVSANTVEGLQDTQKRVTDLESPLAIHYKGVTITPGGFIAAETYWRSHATLGEATPLNAIPFSASGQARTSEFYGSGRQSRLSLLAQGKWGTTNLAGYIETDFLGAGVTSNANQSNSYVLRQRQLWAQAAFHNGLTVTGGQMWSLVMETKKGLDNRTEATPLQIDPNYTAGMSWDRAFGFRVAKNFNNKIWAGFSVENSEILLTASGVQAYATSPPSAKCPVGSPIVSGPNGTTVASCPGSSTFNFLIGGPGTGGGLYNATANYSTNVAPDFVVKVAFEPGFGHYEVFGLASAFRTRVYPNAAALDPITLLPAPSAAGAYNQTIWGGGWGANARWLFYQKHVEVGLHGLGGKGTGRYGDTTLADTTVNGYGQQKALQNYQMLASLEWHSPHWDLYGYGGGEYDGKTWYLTTAGKPVGYGSPLFNNKGCGTETLPTLNNGFGPGALANCAANIKSIVEGTTGFWYKPYNGPKGRLQLGMQYSYLVRTAWVGYSTPPFTGALNSSTVAPKAIENMWFTSFRYYLP